LELELWLETGQTLRTSPDFLLDYIKERAPDWLGKACFCDLAWPQAKTSRLIERTYQKLKRYPEAMRFAAQAQKWEEAVAKKLEALGYPKESIHPGIPSLVSVSSVQVETLLPEREEVRVAPPPEKTHEEFQIIKEHAHYLESQIHHLEGVKENLLRDNLKLNREIDALKDQLAMTSEKSEPATAMAEPEKVEIIPEVPEAKPIEEKIEVAAEKIPAGTLPEKEQILQALNQFQGNRSQAAKALGIHRRTLFQKMKKYDLEDVEFLPGKEEIAAALAECNGNRSEAAKKLGLSRSSFYRRLKELGLG
jgi:DNA-binding protein Fis